MTVDDLKYKHLEGIPFGGFGREDCFDLSRRFFLDNFGIDIPDFARPSDWRADQMDLIRQHYEAAGFEMITDWKPKDLRPADVLAITIGESNPNHLAVYVKDDTLLHHLYGRRSRAEPLHGFWFNQTSFILRHKDVPDLRPPRTTLDLMEIVRVRNAPKT